MVSSEKTFLSRFRCLTVIMFYALLSSDMFICEENPSNFFQHVKLTMNYFRVTWETFKLLGLWQTKNCSSNLQVRFHSASNLLSSQGFLENWKKENKHFIRKIWFQSEIFSELFGYNAFFNFLLKASQTDR